MKEAFFDKALARCWKNWKMIYISAIFREKMLDFYILFMKNAGKLRKKHSERKWTPCEHILGKTGIDCSQDENKIH